MSNKAIIEKEREIRKAYEAAMVVATVEILSPVGISFDLADYFDLSEFCKPLLVIDKKSKTKIVVKGDKLGVLATFVWDPTTEKWEPDEGSKLTWEEYETYTDDSVIEALMDTPVAQLAYGENATPPDGLIPITEAVEIASRGMEIHPYVVKYLNGELTVPNLDTKDIDELVNIIDNPNQNSILRVLATALDNIRNRPNASRKPAYPDFLMRHPFGTDKLIHALDVCYEVIKHEENSLLDPTYSNKQPLRDYILGQGERYTEAVRKVTGRTVLTGTFPIISLMVDAIRKSIVYRRKFYTD